MGRDDRQLKATFTRHVYQAETKSKKRQNSKVNDNSVDDALKFPPPSATDISIGQSFTDLTVMLASFWQA